MNIDGVMALIAAIAIVTIAPGAAYSLNPRVRLRSMVALTIVLVVDLTIWALLKFVQ